MLIHETGERTAWAGLTGRPPWVMGVINVTPDSFSDGGDHLDASHAIAAGQAMLADGAALIDVGGESTRPGAFPIDPTLEQARILPVIRALAADGAVLSVDTRNAATMQAALGAGARIVNDVSALRHDPASAGVVAAAGCPVILMHMRGIPATMASLAFYRDVAAEVADELAAAVAAAEAAGVARAAIAIDPGIGFSKKAPHSVELLRRLAELHRFGLPLVVGVSRKGFVGRLTGVAAPRQRLAGSLVSALHAAAAGASVLRVHDVAATVAALRMQAALAG